MFCYAVHNLVERITGMGENKVDALFVSKQHIMPEKIFKPEKQDIKINFNFSKKVKPNVIPEKPPKFDTIKSIVTKFIPDVSDKFITQILETSEKVKCSPEDLTALIYKESKFKPSAKNGPYRGTDDSSLFEIKQAVRKG